MSSDNPKQPRRSLGVRLTLLAFGVVIAAYLAAAVNLLRAG